jgi:hypothetical protein
MHACVYACVYVRVHVCVCVCVCVLRYYSSDIEKQVSFGIEQA